MAVGALGLHAEPATHIWAPVGFSVSAAMKALFGNFDPSTGLSRYIIPQTTASYLRERGIENLANWGLESGDEMIVRPLRVLEAQEDGKRKSILATYAVPKDQQPFDCHACRPFIGIAIFVRDGKNWSIQSSGDMIAEGGGFGHPASDFRVVRVGPQRIGIEMTNDSESQGEMTITKTIFVAWKREVNDALLIYSHEDDLGGCDEIPCYSNHRITSFVPGANKDYFDIVLVLSGTDITDGPPFHRKLVYGNERFSFTDGFYRLVTKTGDTTSLERDIQEEQSIQSAR